MSNLQLLFTEMAIAACVDGILDPAELELLNRYGKGLGIHKDEREKIIGDVVAGDRPTGYEATAAEGVEAYELVCDVIMADGELDPREKTFLDRMQTRLGLSDDVAAQLLERATLRQAGSDE